MKKKYREMGQQILFSFDKEEKKRVEQNFLETLVSSSLWKKSHSIGVTLSSPLEWETRGIIEQAWLEGKRVCVPKTIPLVKGMDFYELTDYTQIKSGHFGMEEPIPSKTTLVEKTDIDLMLVPGLLYNRSGYRIGFGGGYYDRYLMDYPHTKVALLHTKQLDETFPVDTYDIPLDYLLTEKGWIHASKKSF